jgi:hypothetical protein
MSKSISKRLDRLEYAVAHEQEQKTTVDYAEIIDLMIQGGEQICDYAKTQWISDKYKLGDEMRKQYILEWSEKRRSVRFVGKMMKEILQKEISHD